MQVEFIFLIQKFQSLINFIATSLFFNINIDYFFIIIIIIFTIMLCCSVWVLTAVFTLSLGQLTNQFTDISEISGFIIFCGKEGCILIIHVSLFPS